MEYKIITPNDSKYPKKLVTIQRKKQKEVKKDLTGVF
jgi:hypothetical protein